MSIYKKFDLLRTDLPVLYSVPSDHFSVQMFSPIQMFSFKDASPRLKVKNCIPHIVYKSTFFTDQVVSWCETTQMIQKLTACDFLYVMITFIWHRTLTCLGNPRYVHARRSSEQLPNFHYFVGRKP